MTTYTILQNNDGGATPYIPLKGFLLGNPILIIMKTNMDSLVVYMAMDCLNPPIGILGMLCFENGLFPASSLHLMYILGVLYINRRDQCWGNADAIDNLEVCSAISTKAYYSAWNANIYGLDFNQCPDDEHWEDISPMDFAEIYGRCSYSSSSA